MNKTYEIYLVSDSTGETLDRIFLALHAQFSNFKYKSHLCSFTRTENQIIDDKIHFINQLVGHRNLKLEYHLIKPTKNIATEHLSAKNKTPASRDSSGFV